MENKINIATLAKQMKEGQIIPYGIKKDADGKDNFVILIKESNKKAKKINNLIEQVQMYRVILPIKNKEKTIYTSLFLISFSDKLKYITFIPSGGKKGELIKNELYRKSLNTDRITLVVSNGKISNPYLIIGPKYDKEILENTEVIEEKEINIIGTLLNAIGPKKIMENIDGIYFGDKVFGGEDLNIEKLII